MTSRRMLLISLTAIQCVFFRVLCCVLILHFPQEEDFEEDEGIYDDLNLEEEEEKFGLANDDNNNDSDDSEDASEGLLCSLSTYRIC